MLIIKLLFIMKKIFNTLSMLFIALLCLVSCENGTNIEENNSKENGTNIEENNSKKDKYEGKTFVGSWKAIVENWNDIYFIELKSNGLFFYKAEHWEEWVEDDGYYNVSGDYITIPEYCAISSGYGSEFKMTIINENKMTWTNDFFGGTVITLTRQ